MPVDPQHGRRIPSGAKFARGLAVVLRAAWVRSQGAVEAGRAPDVGRLRDAVARLAVEALGVDLLRGYLQTVRRVRNSRRAVMIGRGIRNGAYGGKALKFDPNDPLANAAVPQSQLPFRIDWSLFRPEVRIEAERLALSLAGVIAEDTRRLVRDAIRTGTERGETNDQIAARVRGDVFGTRRAQTIARTETSRAMHAGEGVAARELGVTEWTWLASSDACELCSGLDGKTVAIGTPFYVHPTGNPAYRTVNHPPAHPHCMCSTMEVMPE